MQDLWDHMTREELQAAVQELEQRAARVLKYRDLQINARRVLQDAVAEQAPTIVRQCEGLQYWIDRWTTMRFSIGRTLRHSAAMDTRTGQIREAGPDEHVTEFEARLTRRQAAYLEQFPPACRPREFVRMAQRTAAQVQAMAAVHPAASPSCDTPEQIRKARNAAKRQRRARRG